MLLLDSQALLWLLDDNRAWQAGPAGDRLRTRCARLRGDSLGANHQDYAR